MTGKDDIGPWRSSSEGHSFRPARVRPRRPGAPLLAPSRKRRSRTSPRPSPRDTGSGWTRRSPTSFPRTKRTSSAVCGTTPSATISSRCSGRGAIRRRRRRSTNFGKSITGGSPSPTIPISRARPAGDPTGEGSISCSGPRISSKRIPAGGGGSSSGPRRPPPSSRPRSGRTGRFPGSSPRTAAWILRSSITTPRAPTS